MGLGVVNLILGAIIFASLTFMSVVYMHQSVTNGDHINHKDSKSISHPLQEQYNVLSESVSEKREELRNTYLLALQKMKLKGEEIGRERDGLDATITEESPRNFLKPSANKIVPGDIPVESVEKVHKPSNEEYDLPGAKEHPILRLSDESFEKTPISEMMSW